MEKEKKLNRRTILIIAICVSLVVDIVLAIIFIPRYVKNRKQQEEYEQYQVSVDTPVIYNNIVSHINDEIQFLTGYEPIKEIYALQFVDKELLVAGTGETDPMYVTITTNYTDVNNCLNSFKDNIESEMTLKVIRESHFDKELNVTAKNKVGEVTSNKYKMYVSFTARYENNVLGSLVHNEFLDSGKYEKITMISHDDNSLLYDFYYYLLNK